MQLGGRVAMIVANYSMAVYLTVTLKGHWKWFRHSPGEFFPVASYMVTGLFAMGCAGVINLVFKSLISLSDPNTSGFFAALGSAWDSFSTRSYPWLTMSFVAAVTLSFLIDLRLPARFSITLRRAIKGVLMALALMLAVTLVYHWVMALRDGDVKVPLIRLLCNSAMIGGVIGYLVPTWFHSKMESARPRDEQLSPAIA